jgi:hypothetical protein
MTIYRGPGGTGEARSDTDVTEVRIIADEAEGYKDQAATSAVAASASAAAAATAETNAETAEANAETAEANAETAQAAAEAAQAAAEAAQTAAEAAQTAAELAETNAETAEANAETAEANAETAQAAAEAALASAQAVYDNFDDRYLGAKTSNPSVDNDGGALLTGALYFNTTVPEMRVYTGSAWVDFSAGAAVSSFNTRTGAVTLTSSDVTTALGYTPADTTLAALRANNLSDLASASTARTNLGLGTAATTASTAYATAAQGVKADTALQSYTETDPVYLASRWNSTPTTSSNWNTSYGWGNHASAGYAADNAVVKLTGDQTVGGTKTFSSTITGSISGNAGTATTATNVSGGTANVTTLTTSSTVTHNGGTANGVTYLNGSKVLTSGSALVFDGSNLGVGVTPSAWGSSYKMFQASTGASFGGTGNIAIVGSNYYNDGSSKYIGTGLAALYLQDSGVHKWFNAASGTAGNAISFTQAMTLDSSGNLGSGVTSPYSGSKADIQIASSTANYAFQVRSFDAGSSDGSTTAKVFRTVNSGGGNWANAQYDAWTHIWTRSGTERMRLDSDGTLLIGRTTAVSGQTRLGLDATASIAGFVSETGPTTTVIHGRFYNGNGNVGNISTNGSATTYSTSSDYRLKHDIAPMTNALVRVAALKPVTYKWNADESVGEGFIAHELAEVMPDAVVGAKDAVETYTDEDGNEQTRPNYQGIDTSFLVATLTAAIQELKAIVDAQGAEIAALKGQA